MACITFKRTTLQHISVPYWFITDYMPQALGGYVKVYLYLLAAYQSDAPTLDLEHASKELGMLYSELILSLEYWHEQKVLLFTKQADEQCDLTFTFDKPQALLTTKSASAPAPNKLHVQQTRPHYSADELVLYQKQHQSIADLFSICEQYLGRLLSNTDQQVLFGLYDWLNMPLDLIEFLVEYCVSNGHTKIRYIEKVALGWVDQNITSIEDAKSHTSTTKQYRQILKALGRSGETITKHERELLSKWLQLFSLDIILEACKRTVLQASSPSLNYLASILDNWAKNNVKTLDDITNLDKTRVDKTQATQKSSAPKNKSFSSMYSHNWDLDELEKRASDYMEQTLYGGNNR